jgi:hypothetical protein
VTTKAEAVTKDAEGLWDVRCPVTDGSCGPFTSTGWPTKKIAQARYEQHLDDHRGVAPAQTLEEFRAAHGLAVDAAGVVRVSDL